MLKCVESLPEEIKQLVKEFIPAIIQLQLHKCDFMIRANTLSDQHHAFPAKDYISLLVVKNSLLAHNNDWLKCIDCDLDEHGRDYTYLKLRTLLMNRVRQRNLISHVLLRRQVTIKDMVQVVKDLDTRENNETIDAFASIMIFFTMAGYLFDSNTQNFIIQVCSILLAEVGILGRTTFISNFQKKKLFLIVSSLALLITGLCCDQYHRNRFELIRKSRSIDFDVLTYRKVEASVTILTGFFCKLMALASVLLFIVKTHFSVGEYFESDPFERIISIIFDFFIISFHRIFSRIKSVFKYNDESR